MITVGHDGEVFLRNKTTKLMVSSIGRIGGTKTDPMPIKHLPKGFCLQEDNVSVEFNIPPATAAIEFATNISMALVEIHRRAEEMGCEVAIDPSAHFPFAELDNPQAQMAGCDPDLDAWTGKENLPPEIAGSDLRACGGHVHIGGVNDIPPFMLARACDVYLFTPFSALDKDKERRTLYGRPGAFRITPWGMEYRTLSNFWLRKPQYMEYVFNGVMAAVKDAQTWIGARGPTPDYFTSVHEQIMSIANPKTPENEVDYYRQSIMSNYRIRPVFL